MDKSPRKDPIFLFFQVFLHSVAVSMHVSGKYCSFFPYLATLLISLFRTSSATVLLVAICVEFGAYRATTHNINS